MKKPYGALLLLALAVLSLFAPALRQSPAVLFPTFSQFSDLMVIHWPKAHLMAQSWQAGQGLPYWTPLILSGMPLAPNQLAMLFYPPAWLFFVLPLASVFNLLFIFHLLLGGCGIFLLLREFFKLSDLAALLGSLTFALNGKWLAHAAAGHVSMVGAIGWMPWVVLGTLMLLATGQPHQDRQAEDLDKSKSDIFKQRHCFKWAWVVAVALAMQILTHTLIFLYSIYLIMALVGWYLLWHTPWRTAEGKVTLQFFFTDLKVRFWPLVSIPLMAGLLGLVQLLPLLELADFSNRSLSLSQAADFAVTPLQLFVGLLLPSPQVGHEHTIYMGLIPLLLMPLGFAPLGFARKNHWRWFFGGLLLLSLLFALGPSTPIHQFFYNTVPGFRWVRTPARMFFVGALALAVLVGFGAERLRQADWSAPIKRWLPLIGVACGGGALMIGAGLAFGFEQANRASFALVGLVPAGLSLILLSIKGKLTSTIAIALLGLLLFLDLASFDSALMRFIRLEEALAPGQQAAEYLAQKPGLFRIYSPSYSLPMQTAAVANLMLADGVEPVHLSIYDHYMAQAGGYQDDSFSVTIPNFGEGQIDSVLSDTEPNLHLLGLLNVKYVAAAFPMDWAGLSFQKKVGETFIYRNEFAQPRAWFAMNDLPIEEDWLSQLTHLPDSAQTTLVTRPALREDKPTEEPPPVKIERYTANWIEATIETNSAGWVVFSEIWYPGWQVTLNGQPHPIEPVNGLLRGLYINAAGTYKINMVYHPPSIIWGGGISGLTAIMMIVIGFWLWRPHVKDEDSVPLFL